MVHANICSPYVSHLGINIRHILIETVIYNYLLSENIVIEFKNCNLLIKIYYL